MSESDAGRDQADRTGEERPHESSPSRPDTEATDATEEEGRESFPASDPPANSGTT